MGQQSVLERQQQDVFLPMTKAERDLLSVDVTDQFATHGITVAGFAPHAPAWLAANRTAVMAKLSENGFCIIRGLAVIEPADFRSCVEAMDFQLVDDYGDLPMLPSDDGTTSVFNVTKYPAKNAILFHSEGTHTHQPPRHIFFQCSLPAEKDGETPLARTADVLQALPTTIRRAFSERGLMYRRNFIDGLDVSWQKYFNTGSREEVAARCAKHKIHVRWRPDGGLETSIFRPAVIQHPDSGNPSFVNQVLLHHPSCLDPAVRAGLLTMLDGKGFPRDVCFGDGMPIPDEWIAEVLRAHIRVAVTFRWRAGDIVLADNFSVAHARRPYTGVRKHHVILGRP